MYFRDFVYAELSCKNVAGPIAIRAGERAVSWRQLPRVDGDAGGQGESAVAELTVKGAREVCVGFYETVSRKSITEAYSPAHMNRYFNLPITEPKQFHSEPFRFLQPGMGIW